MATLIFDTYEFIRTLKEAGVKETDAIAIAEGLKKIDLQHVATKSDLFALETRMLKWLIPLFLGQYALLIGMLVKLL